MTKKNLNNLFSILNRALSVSATERSFCSLRNWLSVNSSSLLSTTEIFEINSTRTSDFFAFALQEGHLPEFFNHLSIQLHC
jgi:hypothetical protein